ncbi:unnamed protein product [Ceratitis capitata]|uniref:(Mediterranean fruit fly) hypothetical protein n=1 Tax=Ceratitis capitata TaxID=7213 RepID=A0A811V8K2_CERCA|nr:unnamed protein product [Ceratitis capitata]
MDMNINHLLLFLKLSFKDRNQGSKSVKPSTKTEQRVQTRLHQKSDGNLPSKRGWHTELVFSTTDGSNSGGSTVCSEEQIVVVATHPPKE